MPGAPSENQLVRPVALPIIVAYALLASSPGEATEGWRVNAWGSVSPSYTFKRTDPSCGREGSATSFKVLSRGNGDAEVVLPAALEPNKAYRFTIWLNSERPASVEVFFRRDGFPYETTAIRSVRVSKWAPVDLSGIHASNGRGSVRISVREEGVLVCMRSATLMPAEASAVGAPITGSYVDDGFFGIHLNRLGVHNGWPTFDPGSLRLWDTGTTWAQLQPTNEPIDWRGNPYAKRLDYYVSHGLARHRHLQFIYTLGMTPAWAGRVHPQNCNNSSYGPSVCTKPIDIDSWREHVKALGARYKGIIRIWEIWNEADVWVHWDHAPEDLVPLVRIAAQELKRIDPQNKVIGPNITSGGLRFLSRFLAAGGGEYLDGVSIHAYLGRVPELSVGQVRNLREMLKGFDLAGLPVWNTETAVSCNSLLEDCKPGKVDNRLSGENALAQGLIANAALGVKSFVYYTWEGAATEYGNLPLVNADYATPTKAGRVLSTLKAWFSGAEINYRTASKDGLNVVEVRRGGRTSLVLWSSGRPVPYDLADFSADRYALIDGGGTSRPLESTRLQVGDEPVMVYSSRAPRP